MGSHPDLHRLDSHWFTDDRETRTIDGAVLSLGHHLVTCHKAEEIDGITPALVSGVVARLASPDGFEVMAITTMITLASYMRLTRRWC